MKYPTASLRSICFTCAIFSGSFVAGLWRQSSVSLESGIEPSAADTTGSFVQEPIERRSFRPDFSASNNRIAAVYNNRLSPRMLNAFSEALTPSWKTAVRIMANGEQVALGMIVDENGWIVTKASQLPNSSTVFCRLFDYRELTAEVVSKVVDVDLALLRVEASQLPSAKWGDEIPVRGNWVATADLKQTPSSVGVVSAGVQRIKAEPCILGVNLADTSAGAAVAHVLRGTGAFDAGLKLNDNIFEVNGSPVQTQRHFKQLIGTAMGGDFVKLKVDRAGKELEMDVRLMDLTSELLDDTEMEVNGRVSARATGFNRVFLHDTVLEPNQCGGPIVNLDGEVVGINIARAGRVTSYALPVDVVKPIVANLISEAKPVSHNAESGKSPEAALR